MALVDLVDLALVVGSVEKPLQALVGLALQAELLSEAPVGLASQVALQSEASADLALQVEQLLEALVGSADLALEAGSVVRLL